MESCIKDTVLRYPCGKCLYCKHKKMLEWAFRIMYETKVQDQAWFCTFTYADEHLPVIVPRLKRIIRGKLALGLKGKLIPTLLRKDYDNLKKRLHKAKKGNKYFGLGEYGEESLRPHYHMIIWNMSKEQIESCWTKGWTTVTPVTIHRAKYVAKYSMKDEQIKPDPLALDPFRTMSRGNHLNPKNGIGIQYVEDMKKYHKENLNDIGKFGDWKVSIPRYLKDKIFSDEEKFEMRQKKTEYTKKKFRKELEYYRLLGIQEPERERKIRRERKYELLEERIKQQKIEKRSLKI